MSALQPTQRSPAVTGFYEQRSLGWKLWYVSLCIPVTPALTKQAFIGLELCLQSPCCCLITQHWAEPHSPLHALNTLLVGTCFSTVIRHFLWAPTAGTLRSRSTRGSHPEQDPPSAPSTPSVQSWGRPKQAHLAKLGLLLMHVTLSCGFLQIFPHHI